MSDKQVASQPNEEEEELDDWYAHTDGAKLLS